MSKAVKYSDNFTIVSQNLGYSGAPKSIQRCSGGCIHDSNVWTFPNGERFFVKFSNKALGPSMLTAEFRALELIANSHTVRCPKPIFADTVPNEGFVLVMEYLELQQLDSKSGERLGHHLALLHKSGHCCYGFESDNFIGATPQVNTPCNDWAAFFWENRILFQIELARKNHYRVLDSLSDLEFAVKHLLKDQLLNPSLLHGDLWGGNAAALPDGTPVVFDPASYYGAPETDLTFTEVFGGFPQSFYHAYQDISALNPGYSERKIVYNLYHYLNHLNLFGSSYLGTCDQIIKHLLNRFRK